MALNILLLMVVAFFAFSSLYLWNELKKAEINRDYFKEALRLEKLKK